METLLLNPALTITDYTGEKLQTEPLLNRLQKLAFCVTDQNGNFVEVNDNYIALYGFTQQELIGNHFSMVVPEEYRTYATRIHNEFIAGLKEMPAEWTVQRKSGELVKIFAEAIRVEEEDGTPNKLTVIEVLE
jgi:two-component system CheB/CheR fusion protein